MGNYSRWVMLGAFALVLLSLLINRESQSTSESTRTHVPPVQNTSPSMKKEISRALAQEGSVAPISNEIWERKIDMSSFKPAPVAKVGPQELIDLPSTELSEQNWKKWIGKKGASPQSQNQQSTFEIAPGNFLILDNPSDSPRSSDFSKESPWIVYNERLNTIGVLTGSISVIARSPEEFANIVEELNLTVVHEIPSIQGYIVTSKLNSFDPFVMVETLKSKPQIERAELEIVSRSYVQ